MSAKTIKFKKETDEQIIERISKRFNILDEMTKACINGDVRAMIVVGPPGVGKSYGVEQQLEKASIMTELASRPKPFDVVKGAMSAIGLYTKLFSYKEKDNVLVFDDCDSVLQDDLDYALIRPTALDR
jgi:replicative DNA helicase